MKKIALVIVVLAVLGGYGMAGSILPNPMAKMTFIVVDEETGEPISDVDVGVSFRKDWESSTRSEGITNIEGECTITGRGTHLIRYSAEKEGGYYKTLGGYAFEQVTSNLQLRHQPWNPKITVKLRKIKKPVPMYARRVDHAILPELGKKIGFDLMEADWVAPYGKGKVSDFVFLVTKEYSSEKDFKAEMTLTFSNSFDGIYAFPIDDSIYSDLKLPHLAPLDGYQKELKKFHSSDMSNDYNERQHYYFRIRSEEKDGKLQKALYGKIYNDIKINPFGYDRDTIGKPVIRFEYYLNPDGTRNTEFDPKKNLFSVFNSDMEKVQDP